MIDYWCNCFLPDRRALWDAAVGEQGLSIKTRRDGGDGFAEPAEMIARMDELGIAALLLPTAEIPEHADAFAFERYASQPEEARELVAKWPGRFASLWSFDPTRGLPALRRAARALSEPGCVGLHYHTHSYDRAFDHRDMYPSTRSPPSTTCPS
jgi:predicted TIM-barrel fold metal-dependent hydrolase